MEIQQEFTTQEIRKQIQEQDWVALERILAPVHPADIAELLEALSADDQIDLFEHLPLEVASEVFQPARRRELAVYTWRQASYSVACLPG